MTSAPPDLHNARRTRVGFLTSHPFQYAAPLYAYLNRLEDIEPVALYLTDFSLRGAHDKQFGQAITWDLDLLAGYEHHFVGKDWQTAEPYGFWSLKGDDLERDLAKLELDALVVHGHNFLAMLQAMLAGRQLGIPLIYKGETHLLLPRKGAKALLRKPLMGALYSQLDGFLAISQRNRDFYRAMGVPAQRIFDYPYTVDNQRFIAASRLSDTEREAVRADMGLAPGIPVVTFASKFMARKHPADLIKAGEILRRRGHALQLLYVGTGELEEKLRALAATCPELPVVFAGFRNQTELPRILGASDIFVLPSEDEPFGLIINEAMCAGLPIVAASEIGCVPDLVRHDENGRLFDARDATGLADALEPLVANSALREEMGRRSRSMMDGWSFGENAAGLRQALQATGAERRPAMRK